MDTIKMLKKAKKNPEKTFIGGAKRKVKYIPETWDFIPYWEITSDRDSINYIIPDKKRWKHQ